MKAITYKKILVTHDGSTLASKALPHAVSLVKAYNAELVVLHVIDSVVKLLPAITITPATIGTQGILEDLAKQERKAAKNVLKHIKLQLDKAGITDVTVSIEEGDARDKIVQVANRHACDLIVMSTHGRSGIKRALLGSIADDVVKNAPCPVLLVKAKMKEK